MQDKAAGRRETIARVSTIRPLVCGVDYTKDPLAKIYGSLVFGEGEMRARLPGHVFERLKLTMREGRALDQEVADFVAVAMRDWAEEHGATHYTHWFQPMTGYTAEKHDAFLALGPDGAVLSEFSGKMLVRGESDASSFPSGGIRSTFEARGYTAWDPRSPVFIKESHNGRTLCIPTAFCSYTGECLDRKTPLLRSAEALSHQALRILRLFGDDKSTHVTPTLGAEQEYFLVDRMFFLQRPDLVNTGRTLYGARPPKGQEMEDHYYGAIRGRVLAFMMDLEKRLYKLGIPAKTRHNEAAPAQFELAPLFEDVNIATDHNMLIMESLRGTARDHGLVCLLHEKPFKGVNGSGKHNNWSMSDSSGNNLLDPGDTPHENAKFLVFLCAVLRAVHKYGGLLRLGTVGAGNDHRLGAYEAPPAIFSIFLGSQLTDVVESIMAGGRPEGRGKETMRIGVTALPTLPRDATDRNRTSPVAFTGNKFEFRAVGSSQSCAPLCFLLNTAVSEALDSYASELEAGLENGRSLHDATQALLQKEFVEHAPVLFNGDNYSAAWLKEAQKRGLAHHPDSVSAIKHFTDEENLAVLSRYAVLSPREVQARREILFENYSTSIGIESQMTLEMGRTILLPAAIAWQKSLSGSIKSLKDCLGPDTDAEAQEQSLARLSRHIRDLIIALDRLEEELYHKKDAGHAKTSPYDQAKFCRDTLVPIMSACRAEGDALENLVDDSHWPLPKYRELLWIY